MKRVLGALVVSVAVAASPLEDPATLVGRVRFQNDPVPFANILIGAKHGTMTDGHGTFQLGRLSPGLYTIEVRAIGYGRREVAIHLGPGQRDSIDVEMSFLAAPPSVGGLVASPWPCRKPDPADTTCISRNPDEIARVGSRCDIHRRNRLQADIVKVSHGIVGYSPGFGGDERKHFPNARVWWPGGCVAGGPPFTEVAYCERCRAIYTRRQSK